MLIGLSTHAPGEIDAAAPFAADGSPLVDYIGVGPVHDADKARAPRRRS